MNTPHNPPVQSHTHFVSILSGEGKIAQAILSRVSPASLLRLSRTCREVQVIVQKYMLEAFDIDRHFSRFFPNPSEFCSLQASTGAIVSGSNALQFFNRSHYPESDLDVYAPVKSCQIISDFMLGLGYEFVPSSCQLPTFKDTIARRNRPTSYHTRKPRAKNNSFEGIRGMFTFSKMDPSDLTPEAPRLKVQLILTAPNPMEAVFNFHSSTSQC